MPVNWTTNYQFDEPAAGAAISITPSGSINANSAYTQILASASADLVLTGAVVGTPGAAVQFQIDIAVGAAASEANIATVAGTYGAVAAGIQRGGLLRIPIGIDAIPSGSRLSFRIRLSTTSVTPWAFAFQYFKKPIVGTLLITKNILQWVPNAASLIALTASTTGWGNVAWVQLTAATATAQILAAFVLQTRGDFELEFGVGAAGVEVPITAWRGRSNFLAAGEDGPGWFALDNPLSAIPIGSRVAARWRTGTAASGALGYAYQASPLL